jgi:DNA primase
VHFGGKRTAVSVRLQPKWPLEIAEIPSCSAHGDVITFVMEREQCSFQEACERLSSGGRPPVVEPTQRTSGKPSGRRWEQLSADSIEARVLEVALQVYETELWQNARAQAYLRRRAIPDEVARAQRLGYANGHALLHRLKDGNESDAELLPVAVQLGLVLEHRVARMTRPPIASSSSTG